MINGEGWLKDHETCDVLMFLAKITTHKMPYPLRPLNHHLIYQLIDAVLLYPSLGLFEGTMMSVGRGASYPFEVLGHPDYLKAPFFI
jgi:hypothetical protein